MKKSIIDKHILEEIRCAGSEHILKRYRIMRDELSELCNKQTDSGKASVISDISNVLHRIIEGIENAYPQTNNNN